LEEIQSVLAYASHFAKIFGASVNILYVIDYLTTPPAYLMPYIEQEKKVAEEKIEELKKQLSDSGISSTTEIIGWKASGIISGSSKKDRRGYACSRFCIACNQEEQF